MVEIYPLVSTPAQRIRMTPEEAYAGLVVSFERGSWLYVCGLSAVLQRFLKEGTPRHYRWAPRIPVIVEMERVARERLSAERAVKPVTETQSLSAISKDLNMPKISEEFNNNFIKAEELDRPITFTIDEVEIVEFNEDGGGKKKKVVVTFKGKDRKKLVLNATRREVMVELFGDDTDDWIGRKVTLNKGKTMFAGKRVDTIEVKEWVRPVRDDDDDDQSRARNGASRDTVAASGTFPGKDRNLIREQPADDDDGSVDVPF